MLCFFLWQLIHSQITSRKRFGLYDRWWASSCPFAPQNSQRSGFTISPFLNAFLNSLWACCFICFFLATRICRTSQSLHALSVNPSGTLNPGQSHRGQRLSLKGSRQRGQRVIWLFTSRVRYFGDPIDRCRLTLWYELGDLTLLNKIYKPLLDLN